MCLCVVVPLVFYCPLLFIVCFVSSCLEYFIITTEMLEFNFYETFPFERDCHPLCHYCWAPRRDIWTWKSSQQYGADEQSIDSDTHELVLLAQLLKIQSWFKSGKHMKGVPSIQGCYWYCVTMQHLTNYRSSIIIQ